VADRKIGFGDFEGQPAWQQVPGEFRTQLRRLIVTQGDTEPASVEQQRRLGKTAPSLLDLRNLFQVNVEEGRHLWAMVYLLHGYFGRDGREEAEALLERRSGDSPYLGTSIGRNVDFLRAGAGAPGVGISLRQLWQFPSSPGPGRYHGVCPPMR
jgi:hypothetical protein